MPALENISQLLNKWFIWVGGVSLLTLAGIACANMLLRPLGAPLKGAYELGGVLGALTGAFALGYTQISHSHISVDILSTRYSKRTRKITDAISSILCTLFFLLVAWQTIVFGNAIWKRGETSETLRIIYHPFVYVVALCCALLAFTLLVAFLKLLTPTKRGR